MNTLDAFVRSAAARGNEHKVFDWNRAAYLIRESGVSDAYAGLSEDWEWTGDCIFRDGEPVPEDEAMTFLSSNWATPELVIGNGETTDCYLMQSQLPDWDAETYWPQSALDILNYDADYVEVKPLDATSGEEVQS